MYLKKVKINATTQRLKLVFQESKTSAKLGGMALQSKEDERFGIITLEEGARHPEDHEDPALAGEFIIPLDVQLANAVKRYPVGGDYSDVLAFGEQVVTKDGEVIPRLYDIIQKEEA